METEQRIPKIIHYFWFGHGKMNKKYKKYIEGWKKLCPDYEIKKWDESNIDITMNRYMKEAYEAGKWSFVSDYARLYILYKYGGIQLDTDVEMLKSYSDFLGYDGFIGFEDNDKVNDGQCFGVIPGHPLVKEMLEEYENLSFTNPDGSFNKVLSPENRTRCLVKHGLKLDGTRQNICGIEVFPRDYFCPMDFLHTLQS